jgi:hypothetical protein
MELQKYIGKEFNEEIKTQIESQFKPYIVTTCSLDIFYCENYWDEQIRCALVDGKIANISFN